MNPAFLIPISFFAFLAAVIIMPAWFSHRTRQAGLRLLAEAASQGRALDQASIDRLLTRSPPNVGKGFALTSLFFGVSGLAIGIALFLAVFFVGMDREALIGALVQLALGVGLTTLGVLSLVLFSGKGRPAPVWNYGNGLALVCLFFGVSGLSLGAGLGLAGILRLGPPEILIGALVNGCLGAALTGLGTLILILFGADRGS